MKTKVDIISGFLGAGKTTLIKKLLKEGMTNEQVVLIENEFGEIGIDGGFLKDAGIEIREMNSGCICCSLVGDFGTSLKEVIDTYHPDRILIEPSGVGKLSDVIKAVQDVQENSEILLNSASVVVDASKCKIYMKNFGEFFNNQIEHAGTIILSRTQNVKPDALELCVQMIREHNENAHIVTTPWDDISAEKILDAMEDASDLEKELVNELHHDDHHHGEECGCGHHHDHDEECGCGHHHEHEEHEHHHDHDEECGCGHHHDHEEHEHHRDHDGECSCGHHHDHEEHGHHHADDVFTSWGIELPNKFTRNELDEILEQLADTTEFGTVLRAKGMLPSKESEDWLYFDLVPGEYEIREGKSDFTGRICVIGADLEEDKLKKIFTEGNM